MKKLLTLLLLTLALPTLADRITIAVTVTGVPTHGLTFSLNGVAKTWTTNAPSSTQMRISATNSISATNWYTQLTAYPWAGKVTTYQTATNALTFYGSDGQAMTASLPSATWGFYTATTNATTPGEITRAAYSTVANTSSNLTASAAGVLTNALLNQTAAAAAYLGKTSNAVSATTATYATTANTASNTLLLGGLSFGPTAGVITGGMAGVSVSGLTNTGGFFLWGAGTIGTNGSTSSLTVNMPSMFTALTNSVQISSLEALYITTNAAKGYLMRQGTNVPVVSFGAVNSTAINRVGFSSADGSVYSWLYTDSLGSGTVGLQVSGLLINNCLSALAGGAPNLVNYAVNSGSTVKRTRTATLTAIWPSLSVIGEASTNLVNISGCVTNTSHILVSVFPVETGVIYKAGVFTNGTAIVIREALVAVGGATNFVRVTDFGF